MTEDRSLRARLRTKMPAPLADIVLDCLREPIETHQGRYKKVVRQLEWVANDWVVDNALTLRELGSMVAKVRHSQTCGDCWSRYHMRDGVN